ncbi:MFS transporter [Geodermatophilus sp. FMUSA9-8]|uniref:MFS transporter n=1 Tax=Geodermatophilus sp. FMUSA9-8 TaxID=3120155 RepID=UPI0030099331
MSGPAPVGAAVEEAPPLDPRRWRALSILALVQLMLILDTTVVNVALPTIRDGLGFTTAGLAWVVNGYALASGGLLVLGGRLGDLLGRRRVFLAGVTLFALASLACGLAVEPWQLVAGRFAQGAGGALAAPSALALVALLFPDARERSRALAVWGGLTGIGGTAGVLLSGVLTDLASWRWVFLLNLPIAAAALLLVPRLVPSRAPAGSRPLDLTGAVLVTAGLVLLIDGLLQLGDGASSAPAVVLRLAGGAALVLAFLAVEARAAAPLVPLPFFRDRTRATAYGATVVSATAMASVFYLLTLHMQGVLGWSPLRIGLAWVPFGGAMLAGVSLAGAGVRRVGLRWVLVAGFAVSAAGLAVLAQMGTTATFTADVLPGTLLLALGLGLSLPTVQVAALHGTTDRDAGLASGVHATASHLGGSVGLAVFVAVAVARSDAGRADGEPLAAAVAAGHSLAWWVATGLLVAGAVLAAVLVRPREGPAVRG